MKKITHLEATMPRRAAATLPDGAVKNCIARYVADLGALLLLRESDSHPLQRLAHIGPVPIARRWLGLWALELGVPALSLTFASSANPGPIAREPSLACDDYF